MTMSATIWPILWKSAEATEIPTGDILVVFLKITIAKDDSKTPVKESQNPIPGNIPRIMEEMRTRMKLSWNIFLASKM